MNHSCRAIHETIIRDLVDLFDYAQQFDAEDIVTFKKRSPYSKSSLTNMTSNLVLTFPVICSRNLSIEAMTMTAKAIERKAVIMLQLLFSAYKLTEADNIEDILRQFHNNIKLGDKVTVDDIVFAIDHLAEQSGASVDRKLVKAIQEDMRNITFTLEENKSSLRDMKITRNAYGIESIYTEADHHKRGSHHSIRRADSRVDKNRKDAVETFSKRLMDSDIKKANELVPSMLVVSFVNKNPKDGITTPIEDVVIGVKARMVPMDSDDIINHVLTKVEDKNWLIQFIRATTREISFFKDFLFAIDKAKIDALSNSRRGSSNPMWKVLERRAVGSKINRSIGRSNDVMAITTLVVSQEEVDYVRKEHNVNFEDYRTIAPVMEAYNLMGFVILDESLEVAKFLFDTGEGNFENLSFTNLERENNDNSYRKIVNLMTKISR